jgi:iron-sulfur cluster repair protein YtfE (RIC family)
MNVTEFTAALNTVEQDHQLVLDKVQALKELVGRLLAPEDLDAPRVLNRLRELDAFFATQLADHMDEEEMTLFPLFEHYQSEGPALTTRLRQDHDEIRRKLAAFNSSLGVALDLQDGLPRAVLWDLLVDGWELWELLDRHAHAETEGLRQCLTHCFRDQVAFGAKSQVVSQSR